RSDALEGRALAKGSCSSPCFDRLRVGAEKHQTKIAGLPAREPCASSDTHDRVVAVAPCELEEDVARLRRRRGNIDGGDDFVRRQRGGVEAGEEVARRDRTHA